MKKGILSLILLMAISLILTGCRGGGTTTLHTHIDQNKDGICDVCNEKTGQSERQFNVQFNLNYTGAPKVNPIKVTQGTTATKPEDPVREGYRFKGWYMDSKGKTVFDFTKAITKNNIIYAIWEDMVAKVSFDLNFDTDSVIADIEVEIGNTIALPTDPTRENYRFDGWYIDQACTTAFDNTKGVEASLTLYAKWTKTHDYVTYNANFEGSGEPVVVLAEFGKVLTFPTTITRENYKLDGWYLEAACTTEFSATDLFTEATTLYAKWTKTHDYVTYNQNYEGSGEPVVVLAEFGKVLTFPTVTREHYRFDGWYLDQACTTEFSATDLFTEATTLYAKWTMTEAVFTLDLNYDDSINPTQVITLGGTATRPTDPERRNYEFVNWYSDKACTTLYDFTTPVNDNMSIYAKWNEVMAGVSFNLGYETENTIPDQSVNFGQKATRPAQDPTRDRYEFVNWYTDSTFTTVFDFNQELTTSVVVYAKWNQLVAIVTFDLNYTEAPQATTSNVNVGSKVTKDNPTRANYEFMGWFTDQGCTSAFDIATTNITSDMTLYAKWKLNEYTVTFDLNYTGSTPTTTKVNHGDAVNKPTDPVRDGYTFIRWELNGVEYDFTIPVTSDITLKAVFEEIPTTATVTFNLNYTGAPNDGVLSSADVNIGSKATKPTDPTRTNYRFFRWTSDQAGTTPFNFDQTEIEENTTLYAQWLQKVVFEAEYTFLPDEKIGAGYSNGGFGIDLIDRPEEHRKDNDETNPPTPTNTSNGAWVSMLYYEGSTVEFIIYSDIEQDVLASMSISGEFGNMTIKPQYYQFRVNGVSKDYPEQYFQGEDHALNDPREDFREVFITSPIHLKQGENVIILIATNDFKRAADGTMNAWAPMVDCITIYAAEDSLDWDPYVTNLTGVRHNGVIYTNEDGVSYYIEADE